MFNPAGCCEPQTVFKDKKDREGAFFSATQALCSTCRDVVQAKILIRHEQVILQKNCLKHGMSEALMSSDTDYWIKSLSFTKPGTIPREWSTEVSKGCPLDCGLCPDHEQHTCAPIIEISNQCDLKCPVCIVWNQNNYDMSEQEFRGIIDGLIRKEGSLELILLSGGEPTLHPRFFELCEYARSQKGIHRILVSSHGIRIGRDAEFAKRFKEMGLYLSLQFDSLKNENYKTLRGANLLQCKMDTLAMCEKFNIPTVFVPTVARGFNDNELGEVVKLALSKDFVTSVTIQPMAYTGAGGGLFPGNPLERLTQVDIHKALEKQLGWLKKEDFMPIPCSHPSCYTACYLIKLPNGEFAPLTRFVDVSTFLNLTTNRSIMDSDTDSKELLQDSIYKLWSAQALTVDTENVLKSLKAILMEYQKTKGTHERLEFSEKHVKAIFIHAFMDENDFEVSRIRKCCTHYALPDGRLMPGCAYNTIHRERGNAAGLKALPVIQ